MMFMHQPLLSQVMEFPAETDPREGRTMEETWGSHLVVMGQDGCDLAAGESDILARKLIDSPGSGIEGMVECKVPAKAPVPAAQDTWALHGQDLLVHSPSFSTQAHCELNQEGR